MRYKLTVQGDYMCRHEVMRQLNPDTIWLWSKY